MGKVRVKAVFEKDPSGETVEPILIRFQHATTNSQSTSVDLNNIFRSAVFQTDSSVSKDYSHLNRSGFENRFRSDEDVRSTRSKKRQLVALQSDSMTYIGSNNTDDMMRTYVALKNGKKMRIYEVTPITVAPFIKGHSHVVEKERDTGVKKSRDEKKADAVDLIKAFGSKRKRLTYEKFEKNQIDVSDMNESMNKATKQLKIEDEEPQIKDESVLTLIPPCNREATDVNGVYNVYDILSQEELDDMEELAQQFLNLSSEEITGWQTSKMYSDYFFAMWKKLSLKKSDRKAVRNAKLVLYTELLISISKMSSYQIMRKIHPSISEIFPQWLKEKAMDTFTIMNAKGVRNRPESSKDKTSCYVMVLVLLVNDFIFDVQLMSTSLNIHIKKLLTLAKAVGITVSYNSTAKEYKGLLKLPLPKPIERRGRRRTLR